MKLKGKLVILAIALVAIVFIGLNAVTSSTARDAFLMVDSGSVQIDSGDGWVLAENNMDLSEGDLLKTDKTGEAVVVLYESFMVRLDADTEVSLDDISKDHVKVGQTRGTTWNKFTKLMGLTSAEIETPSSVATVRGTEYKISYDDVNGFEIVVVEGNVEIKAGEEIVDVGELEKYVLEVAGTEFVKVDMTVADKKEVLEQSKKTVAVLKDLRTRELEKHSFILNQIKSKYELTDKDIQESFDAVDRGEIDDREALKKSPVPLEAADVIIAMNDKIKEQNKLVEGLEAELVNE